METFYGCKHGRIAGSTETITSSEVCGKVNAHPRSQLSEGLELSDFCFCGMALASRCYPVTKCLCWKTTFCPLHSTKKDNIASCVMKPFSSQNNALARRSEGWVEYQGCVLMSLKCIFPFCKLQYAHLCSANSRRENHGSVILYFSGFVSRRSPANVLMITNAHHRTVKHSCSLYY